MSTREILIPTGVKAVLDNDTLIITGPKGSTKRVIDEARISIQVTSDKIILGTSGDSRHFKKILCTYESHVLNLIHGVTEGYECKLKVCFAHFPITVKVNDKNIFVENFLGEKKPRKTKIVGDNTKVAINDKDVTVTGINKEEVGQTAANMEIVTRIRRRDRRVFQDGIWITSKAKGDIK